MPIESNNFILCQLNMNLSVTNSTAWLILLGAGLLEIVWSISMKASDNPAGTCQFGIGVADIQHFYSKATNSGVHFTSPPPIFMVSASGSYEISMVPSAA